MLKHPELTRRRIDVFLKQQLLPLRYLSEHPLQVEFNEKPCATEKEARKGPWKPVEKGFEYGPAYKVVWFRITGVVPPHLQDKDTVINAEVGGERTVWRDGAPYCGIDVEHSDFGWLDGSKVAESKKKAAGTKIDEIIQAYTRNAQTTVWGKEKPREELVEKVGSVKLVEIDREVVDLVYDFEFAIGLVDTIDKKNPSYTILLRALNDAVNAFNPDRRETFSRSKRLIRDGIGSLTGEKKHTVYPVGHAHLDTAWLWPLEITRLKMAHTTANQLRLIDRYPDYVFAHSQASQYEWLEKEYPGLFEDVKKAIAKGQWEPVGSMWVEADCNLTGSESLVRQFLYGKRYFREKLGVETHDMWLPDVFGYSAALPQILNKFGIKYFLTQKISWNQINKFPHHTFWWQGIDGSKVWSHFPPADTYNGSGEPKEVAFSVENYKDHGRADQSLYAFGYGDGGGGPTERHIELLKRGRIAPEYPEIALGKKAIDFFEEAYEHSKDLATWVGELYLELHRGTYTSQAANKRNNRKCEFLLRDAEWLASFTSGYPKSYPSKALEEAWKLVLLNQFHDIIPGSSVREVYEDSDKDYEVIEKIGDEEISKSLKSFGAKLDSSAYGDPFVLFHNSAVSLQSSIAIEDIPSLEGKRSLIAGEESLPIQEVDEWGDKKVIFTTPAAALGSVTVAGLSSQQATSRPRLKASSRKIENDQFAIRFDQHGNIASLQSLEDGIEFIEPGKLGNLFQLLDDHPLFWSAWDVDLFSFETARDLVKSERFEIVERGPVRVAAEIEKRFSKSLLKQRISLTAGAGIRFDTWVDWREEDKMLKVAFPFNLNAQRATYEIQFGSVERATHTNTSWDMAKFEVCAQKWVDLSEGDLGVALINQGKYGHDSRGSTVRLSLLRSPKAPDPLCDMGVHRFSYLLLPHFGPHNHASVVQTAYGFNAPLRYASIKSQSGVAGSLPPFVSCDDRNIVIETVKKAEDGDGIIVRVYECHNSRGRASIHCAKPVKRATLVDLEERPLADLEVVDGEVQFEFKPFEIVSVRLDT